VRERDYHFLIMTGVAFAGWGLLLLFLLGVFR